MIFHLISLSEIKPLCASVCSSEAGERKKTGVRSQKSGARIEKNLTSNLECFKNNSKPLAESQRSQREQTV